MNVQHSSRSDSWRTPPDILDRARRVLGRIDLDPASDELANERVKADRIITREQDALVTPWGRSPVAVWLNPPGGKRRNRSMSLLFWRRLMQYRSEGTVAHAIFLAFSLESLQVTQQLPPGLRMLDYPFCVPARRIAFDHPDEIKRAPSHSNAVVYVPGLMDEREAFRAAFESLGAVANMAAPARPVTDWSDSSKANPAFAFVLTAFDS